MLKRVLRWVPGLVAPLFALSLMAGCGANSKPPSSITVELPDGTTETVKIGAGAPSLANSRWYFYRTAGSAQAGAFATVVFGPDGNLEAFENNTLASNIFGTEIIFDNTRRATKQAGLSYIAATYGAETSDGNGFAFEGRLIAFAAGIQAGFGTATAAATFDEDDPDTVRGIFTFTTEVTLISLPEANQDEEFNFVGERVVE